MKGSLLVSLRNFIQSRPYRAALICYLAVAILFLVYVGKGIVSVRLEGYSPTIGYVSDLPVSFYGIYYFTFLALATSFLAGLLRNSGFPRSLLLAACGVSGYQFLYFISFVIAKGRLSLLIPSPGFPATSWQGFSTWMLAQLVFASLSLICYREFGIDKLLKIEGLVFLASTFVWAAWFNFDYPPFNNSVPIFFLNTVSMVSGSLLIPTAFSHKTATAKTANSRTVPEGIGETELRSPNLTQP